MTKMISGHDDWFHQKLLPTLHTSQRFVVRSINQWVVDLTHLTCQLSTLFGWEIILRSDDTYIASHMEYLTKTKEYLLKNRVKYWPTTIVINMLFVDSEYFYVLSFLFTYQLSIISFFNLFKKIEFCIYL